MGVRGYGVATTAVLLAVPFTPLAPNLPTLLAAEAVLISVLGALFLRFFDRVVALVGEESAAEQAVTVAE